jgi:hypothetical protein
MSQSVRLLTVLLLGLGASTSAEPWHVLPDGSGDYPTIQAAVDAAIDNDVIELADGVFTGLGNCDIDLLGKTLIIRSVGGDPGACVIDCSGVPGPFHRGFLLVNSEGELTTLEGFTITNGTGSTGITAAGGAILCLNGSSPAIVNCVFEDNHVVNPEGTTLGGAIHAGGAYPRVIDCEFRSNRAGYGGALSGSFALISGCTFVDNVADIQCGAIGLGLEPGVLENCTFVRNVAPTGGALQAMSASVSATNCILASNLCGGAISLYGSGSISLTCCDIYGNEGGDWTEPIADQLGAGGNVWLDPLFCDLAADDFALHADSPCAPDQSGGCGLIGAWPVACEASPVTPSTWGAIKALYRGE